MPTTRLFFIGFVVVVVAVLVCERTIGKARTAPPAPAPVATDGLQPELALERPDTRRRPPAPAAPPPTPPLPVGIAGLTSASDVRRWLENQAGHLAGETRWSRNDPLVDEFARVPVDYWEVMLDTSKGFTGKARGITEEALLRAADRDHREAVLKAFPDRLFLVDVVTRFGWVEDCADTMRQRLQDPAFTRKRPGDTTELLVALATLQEPRDFTLFADVLRTMRYGYWQARMARALATVPGFDLDAAVTSAWRYHDHTGYPDHQDGFAVAAARAGITDALPIAVLHAAGGTGTAWSNGELQDEARALLREHLGLRVDPADPIAALAWWESVKHQVRWDADTRRWTGPKPPEFAPAQEQPAGTPGADDF